MGHTRVWFPPSQMAIMDPTITTVAKKKMRGTSKLVRSIMSTLFAKSPSASAARAWAECLQAVEAAWAWGAWGALGAKQQKRQFKTARRMRACLKHPHPRSHRLRMCTRTTHLRYTSAANARAPPTTNNTKINVVTVLFARGTSYLNGQATARRPARHADEGHVAQS